MARPLFPPQLRPGPHLEELNAFLLRKHKRKEVEVLSFLEGVRTKLYTGPGGYTLGVEVVPMESAYPGFGDLVVVERADHISICKPGSTDDPAYARAVGFIRDRLQEARAARPTGPVNSSV